MDIYLCVYRGYAIQMIDEIYDRNGHDVPMIDALTAALGSSNGTRVAKDIVSKNPGWTIRTTRFEIWSGQYAGMSYASPPPLAYRGAAEVA